MSADGTDLYGRDDVAETIVVVQIPTFCRGRGSPLNFSILTSMTTGYFFPRNLCFF